MNCLTRFVPRVPASLLAAALGLGALALFCFAAPASAETWRFDASPGERLELDLECGGNVEIVAGGASEVVVESELRGKDAGRVKVHAARSERGVTVRGDVERSRSFSVDASFKISVPEHFDLDISSAGGSIGIVGVDGRIEGKTMGGGLSLERVRGSVSLETMGGAVVARDVDASGSLKTMGGELRFVDVRGNLEASTMGGAVELEGGGPAKLSTMGGNVMVRSAHQGAKVSTMGGTIQVESASAPIEAETMGGAIKARIDGGDGDIRLASMGGTIEVWLPADLSAAFEVELVQTQGRDGAYSIDSDFELTTSREKGQGREVIWRGVGGAGGSAHRVRLSTVNGDIRIHRGN